ncbi:MAG: RDD family protein [Actinomycetia bacterium]|nr:RDD family protein [Actinomycetes bacterium]MCH9801197.1 RDD family protein [Actinomycetes bacterium]
MSDEHDERSRRGPFSRITNAAAGAIDVNEIVERVDVNELVSRVDINELLDRVEPDELLDRVDVNRLLDRVEPNQLLDRVDPDRLLDRVDPDRLLDRVDVDRLMDRVDIDRLLERVDVKQVVDKAGVADIVGDTTGQMAGSVLDAGRRQVVALDEIVGRVGFRVVGKDADQLPEGPPNLISGQEADDRGRGIVQGHYAGPVSRLLAFLTDVAVVFGLYTVITAALIFFTSNILGINWEATAVPGWVGLLVYVGWIYTYATVSLLVAGRTIGKGLLGLMVVDRSGKPVSGKEVVVRVLCYPLSFLFFGIGLLGIIFGKERSAWHDKLAGTAVVYDWGTRSAALPAPLTSWIDKKSSPK